MVQILHEVREFTYLHTPNSVNSFWLGSDRAEREQARAGNQSGLDVDEVRSVYQKQRRMGWRNPAQRSRT